MMPAPRNDRTTPWLERNVDAERGIIATEQDWAVYGPVKDGVSNERVTTNLVGMPGNPDEEQYGFGEKPDPDEETDDDDGDTLTPVPFYTNTHVDDEIAVDRRQTRRKVEQYNRRGGIETAYKKIKEFAAWTTSKEFEVRLWHFGFAVLLYNAWLMVDFLVQVGVRQGVPVETANHSGSVPQLYSAAVDAADIAVLFFSWCCLRENHQYAVFVFLRLFPCCSVNCLVCE